MRHVRFVGGRVFDGVELLPEGTVVQVTGQSISAVTGAMDALPPLPAEDTVDVVDLAGGLLLPGFIDAHIHPIEGGLERLRCDLSGAETAPGYLDLIGEYAAKHPDVPWILGGGWQLAAFPGGTPLASDLDRVVADRPVVLSNRDHHGSWLNSAALALAGITAQTADPTDGRIERLPDGSPAGVLHEGARQLVSHVVPVDTFDDTYRALLIAQQYLHSLGVTGWQDAIVGDYGTFTDTAPVYLKAAQNGDLTAHVSAALWWDRTRGLEQLPGLGRRREQNRHERFTAGTVKVMLDGIPENQTAAMLDPYLTPGSGCSCQTLRPAADRGLSFVDPAALPEYVAALDAHGFQVHVHAIGDRACRDALDSFEHARRVNGVGTNRHHIAHVQIVHPSDVPRFAELDVAANLQTLWANNEPQMLELNVPFLGPERSGWQYPFGDLERTGARLCSGSDWPVTTPDPWAAIHVAVNRTLPPGHPDFNPEPLVARQALSLTSALGSYTSGSAYIVHRDTVGRIAVGMDADLVVTDRNPFEHPPDRIADTRTRQTWARGRIVFTT